MNATSPCYNCKFCMCNVVTEDNSSASAWCKIDQDHWWEKDDCPFFTRDTPKESRVMKTKMEMDTAAYGPTETIKEQDGEWFWADEIWEWHGPCSSRESAQKRQSLYAADLMGEINTTITKDWQMRKDRESEDIIHPCNKAEPWDCDCAGACGCHYEYE